LYAAGRHHGTSWLRRREAWAPAHGVVRHGKTHMFRRFFFVFPFICLKGKLKVDMDVKHKLHMILMALTVANVYLIIALIANVFLSLSPGKINY
jgi:hypothetical protein